MVNVPNWYSHVLKCTCWRPVTHAQTWASYSAVYRFRSLSEGISRGSQLKCLALQSVCSCVCMHIDACVQCACDFLLKCTWNCCLRWRSSASEVINTWNMFSALSHCHTCFFCAVTCRRSSLVWSVRCTLFTADVSSSCVLVFHYIQCNFMDCWCMKFKETFLSLNSPNGIPAL